MISLYLASGNAHKAAEFQRLAGESDLALSVFSATALGGMPAVVEDAGSFQGNAGKKARALRPLAPADAWVLADDSGLCVDELGGGPGVESAYYAGVAGDGAANLQKLVARMREVPAERRGAHFYCLLFLIAPSGEEFIFEGKCEGTLLVEPRGGSGFGYDPLFVPEGFSRSFSELGDDIKNRISHRGRAWARLAEWWRTHRSGGSL